MPKSSRTGEHAVHPKIYADLSLEGPGQAAASRRPPTIPNEILLEIFGYIQPSIEMEPAECTQILSRLSLVCSLFCTMLRPRLFSRLELNGRDERTDPPSAAFCRALLRGDTHAQLLAAHIRTCNITFWSGGKFAGSNGWVGAAFITMYRRALRLVPNIEVLLLSYSKIDSEMWEVVGRFSKLKTLQVSDVSFRDDVPAEEVDHIAALRLLNFSIPHSQVSPLPRLLNPSMLSEFCGDYSSLDALPASGTIGTLKTLTISQPFQPIKMQPLMNILSKVPSVHSLMIYSSIMGHDGITLQDFPALLPNLRSLTCPLSLMTLLAPGRPLKSVGVLQTRRVPLNLDAILGSHEPNTTITELSIPPTIADETPAISRFPRLRKLTLQIYSDIRRPQIPAPEAAAELKSLIISSCDKWAGNHSVQQLDIPMESLVVFPLADLRLQYAMLTESLSQTFPTLLRFQLGEYAVWERFAVGDAWRVLVSAKDRAGLVARLEAGDPGVVDHDGYLRRSSAHNPS
ncbi:hypothetical protein BD779DRAFT_1803425 [Infundibulicybe gibba]|nr:hypothetical protein BD779DRAFT_1803425 [Infundibulicybe gibba]